MTDHPIRLRNSLTGKKEPFTPIDWAADKPEADRQVRMYVCGPTVYDRAHIGNARPVVVFDVLYRLLRHVYGPDHVRYVRNITDIDDKIMVRAKESGRPIEDITDETARWFMEDMAALGALPPTEQPRATEWVPQMVSMIETLIAGGHAYEAEGHVLFAVESYKDYGRLSKRSVDDMIAGARVESRPTSATRWTSCCGSPPPMISPAGTRPGGGGVRAGTSSARPCRRSFWEPISTSMAAARILPFPIMRTRSPSPAAPIPDRASPMSGCITA